MRIRLEERSKQGVHQIASSLAALATASTIPSKPNGSPCRAFRDGSVIECWLRSRVLADNEVVRTRGLTRDSWDGLPPWGLGENDFDHRGSNLHNLMRVESADSSDAIPLPERHV
jgi:hypothetical protein